MPNPIVLKIFVLFGKSGKDLNFEIYQSAGTDILKKCKKLALSLGTSIVLILSESCQGVKVIFDYFLTGMPLNQELRKKEILYIHFCLSKNKLMSCSLKEL